jgi:hypothetical protein
MSRSRPEDTQNPDLLQPVMQPGALDGGAGPTEESGPPTLAELQGDDPPESS